MTYASRTRLIQAPSARAARRGRFVLGLSALALLAPLGPAADGDAAGSASAPPAWCAGPEVSATAWTSAQPRDAERCSLRGKTITFRDVAAVVPARGGVAASAITVDGEQELLVERARDGSVRVLAHHAEAGLAAPAATTTSACRDGAYQHLGYKVRSTEPYRWHYNPKNVPASVRSSAESAIVAATNTAFSGRNACGKPADLRVSHKYAGKNWRHAQVDSAGRCTGNDGWSVTSWRHLEKVLGYACTYYTGSSGVRSVIASDVALNSSWTWFTTKPSRCRGTDLQSVVVHERGHTLGLGHVDPRSHPGQVMTTTIPSCTYKRLLGLGDYRGLVRLYGHR